MGLNGFLGLLDIGSQVDIPDIHKDGGGAPGAFALDHVRPLVELDVGHLLHGDRGSLGSGDQDALQGRQAAAIILKIPQIHRVTFQALHRLGNIFAPQGHGDDLLDVAHGEAVPGRLPALDVKIQVIAADDPFGKDAGGSRHLLQNGLDFLP